MSGLGSLVSDRKAWVLACCFGEGAGIAVVASVYAAIDRGLLMDATVPILSAGGWEGLCLGGAQALVLRRFGISSISWIGLTIAGAVIGYGLSLLGGAGQNDAGVEPSLAMMALLGAGMGIAMGAVMGALQGLAAIGKLRFGRWVMASMAGWAPAMAAIMLGAGSVDASFGLGEIALAGGVSGALAGLALGLVTGLALPARTGRV